MSNASQRIIPLEEGWNDEIKAKASHIHCRPEEFSLIEI